MCGEKLKFSHMPKNATGSPPHVRGKVKKMAEKAGKTRITPACAGKRQHLCNGLKHLGDHPRMCGEKLKADGLSSLNQGSPPHVRGKD